MINYLIGLGSNIDPLRNVPLMVRGLVAVGERVIVSRIVVTEPVGMSSDHHFLNGVALLETSLSPDNLKHYLNRFESKLGRDRTNPNKKTSDRQADFDILAQVDITKRYRPRTLPRDPYCQEVLEELLFLLGVWREPEMISSEGVSLEFGQAIIGLQPMQVYPRVGAIRAIDRLKKKMGLMANAQSYLQAIQ